MLRTCRALSLSRLAAFAARRAWWVVSLAAGLALVASLAGHGLFARLGYAVFYDPAAESTRAAALARDQLGDGEPDVVAVYRLPDGVAPERGVDDPDVRAAIDRLLDRVAAQPEVQRVVGASGLAAPRFVSTDRRSTFVVVSLNGSPRAKAAALPRLRGLLFLDPPGARIEPLLGGLVPSGRALTRLARDSLARGERIALPATAILLVLLFGSVVAALLPIAIGGLAIVLALAVLSLLSRVLHVDAFAVNVVTILGLGVAIDYALFLVNRYREELGGWAADPEARRRALTRAVETAGRVVGFSGLTVAASLAGLLVFRQPFLRSIAVGGLAVTLLAAALALFVLPSLLTLIGMHLERGRIPGLHRTTPPSRAGRFWRGWARAVIRRRIAVCVAATAGLLLLALPFGRLHPSRADVRALPANEEPRRALAALERDFPSVTLQPISILLELDGELTGDDRLGQLFDYSERLRKLPGVTRVESLLSYAGAKDRDDAEALAPLIERHLQSEPPGRGPGLSSILHGRYTLVRVIPSSPPDSAPSQALVRALRHLDPPPHSRALVYGQAAALYDFASSLRARAPLMVLAVMAAMFLVLLAAFGAPVLPLKAMLMTALSLTASFGATVFVFQDGRFQHLLGYTPLGTTDATLPVVMFAVVFGLSMDYEVLILARIREAWLRTGKNDEAIAAGLARTGRLVTSAALLMVVVFSAFAAAPVVYVKALGLGMALAVALDATVVRLLLVPSTMALLGRLNWLGLRRAPAEAPR
jgi:RND superfamily putative drug exporter